ncbi:MAG: hypothetical protein GC185_03285 [Alphaproteobacteria bacterium]|nr:hypothetical protein [Alphaproteobacteria bacterium]
MKKTSAELTAEFNAAREKDKYLSSASISHYEALVKYGLKTDDEKRALSSQMFGIFEKTMKTVSALTEDWANGADHVDRYLSLLQQPEVHPYIHTGKIAEDLAEMSIALATASFSIQYRQGMPYEDFAKSRQLKAKLAQSLLAHADLFRYAHEQGIEKLAEVKTRDTIKPMKKIQIAGKPSRPT